MIGEGTIILRLVVILLLSGFIGWERERLDKPAGFRTHILVGVGSTMIMIVSFSMGYLYPDLLPDVGRIAAQVVSGIGFLGAGTIIREGFSVRGLTTAASLWVTAAVGLAVGVGFYLMAAFGTFLVFITLNYFNRWEKKIRTGGDDRLFCRTDGSSKVLCEIAAILDERGVMIENINIDQDKFSAETMAVFQLNIPADVQMEEVNSDLLQISGIKEIDWRS